MSSLIAISALLHIAAQTPPDTLHTSLADVENIDLSSSDLSADTKPGAAPILANALLKPRLTQTERRYKHVSLALALDMSAIHRYVREDFKGELPNAIVRASLFSRSAFKSTFAFGTGASADGLDQSNQSLDPAFLVTKETGTSFFAKPQKAVAVDQQVGPIDLSFAGERGWAMTSQARSAPSRYLTGCLALGFNLPSAAVRVKARYLRDKSQLIGDQFEGLRLPKSQSLFLSAEYSTAIGDHWILGGAYRHGWAKQGWDRLEVGFIALDVSKRELVGHDVLTLRFVSPVRSIAHVAPGSEQPLGVADVVDLDVATRLQPYETAEFAYQWTGDSGMLSAHLYSRNDPSNRSFQSLGFALRGRITL